MKLHLPSRLRAALLSCFSLVVYTLSTGALLQPSLAEETLYFDSTSFTASHITWQNGTVFANDTIPGQKAFEASDDVVLLKSATLTLGADVEAGVVNMQDQARVTLSGAGHKLTAQLVEIGRDSSLRLTDAALAAGVPVTGYADSLLVFDANGATISCGDSLNGYKGRVEVHGCTLSLAPTATTAFTSVALTGNAVMQLAADSVLRSPITMLGVNTVNVASGTVTLQGEISGSGTMVKTGNGTLNIGPSDEVFRGMLDIQAGTVQWRNAVGNGEVQNSANRMAFENITVGSGATFEDGHLGRNLGEITGIVLRGGRVMAYDMKNVGNVFDGLTENVYRALHVDGTGTLDFEFKGGRRFRLLTAESGSTLTVNNGRERTYNAFDLIKNFDGTINGEAKTDTNQLIIGTVEQAAGMKLTVVPNVNAADFKKIGPGELDLNGTLKATGTTSLWGGTVKAAGDIDTTRLSVTCMLTAEGAVTSASDATFAAQAGIKGALTVGSVKGNGGTMVGTDADAVLLVSGGALTVDGAVNFSGRAEFGAAKVTLNDALTSDAINSRIRLVSDVADVTVKGDTHAAAMEICAGHLTAAAITVDDLTLYGGAVTADSLQVRSLTVAGGSLGVAEDVTVSRRLTMNYNGALTCGGKLQLEDGVVLSYNPGLGNTLRFSMSDLSNVSRLYADVSQVSLETLQSGLDMGLSYASKDKLSIANLAHYEFKNINGRLFLFANDKTPVFYWDNAWGTEEIATAPETLPEVKWTTVAEKVGLYGSTYYDKDNVIAAHVTGGEVTGGVSRVNQIYGGAYGTQPIDAAGGTIERDIWIAVSGGKFEVVGGGSYSLTSPLGSTSGSASAWNLKGDTHIQILEGTHVGSVIGSNVNAVLAPTHEGNSYVSVYSSHVAGSVVGSGLLTQGQKGDTYVNIYKPLPFHDPTTIIDRTITDMSEGLGHSVAANAVVGGVLGKGMEVEGIGEDTADMQGSTNVKFYFNNAAGTTVKTIVGGNCGQGTQLQTGNSSVEIANVGNSTFTGNVAAGHYQTSNIAFRQSLVGNARLAVSNSKGIHMTGVVVTSGHYKESSGGNVTAATQTHTGNTSFVMANIPGAYVTARLVGGHYLSSGFGNTTNPAQEQFGAVDMSLSGVGGAAFTGNIVAGHYATGNLNPGVITARDMMQTQKGDARLTIDNTSANYTGRWLVGGHYADIHANNTTTQSHTDGDIYVTIGNGVFANKVVTGDVHDFTNDWNSTISGGTYLTVTGGTFNNEVVGASVHTGPNGSRAHVGSVHMNLSNATFNGIAAGNTAVNGEPYEHVSIIGGYDLNGRGAATVGDISINCENINVGKEFYGGSWYRGTTNYAVMQGNISLNLKGGTYKDNIYAAGRADCAGILTASTKVALDDTVNFGKIQVSGGYKNTDPTLSTASLVTGTKTLSFVSPGSAYSNIANVTFTEFDTVHVAAADTLVTLNQNLQLMAQGVTKTGAGVLSLYRENELDNVTVREGTLRLAGNSAEAGGTIIEHLFVEQHGNLDISAGNCGINGILTLAEGAGLTVGVGQAAAAVTDLNWAGPVTLNVLGATAANTGENMEIKLFSGLSYAHINGLALDAVNGIDGLAVKAAGYLNSPYAAGAFLVLRPDGTLVLSTKERVSLYWLDGSGEWNSSDARWYENELRYGDPMKYSSGTHTFFVGNGTPADVSVAEDVVPYSLTVKNGTFNFYSAAGRTVSVTSDLVLQNATATFGNEVKFDTYSNIVLDNASTLKLNGNAAVTVYGVYNGGTLDVGPAAMRITNTLSNSGTISAGSLELAQGTQQGGIVNTGYLWVGGDATFTSLQAGTVAGNTGHTLTLNGDSTIGYLDGGSLKVAYGTTTLKSDATLASISGSGELVAQGSLVLQGASDMGTLRAGNLVVFDSLNVVSELNVGAMTLADARALTETTPIVTVGTLATTAPGSTLNVTVESSGFQNKALLTDTVYYLLKAGQIDCGLTVNGTSTASITDGRYCYTITPDSLGLQLTSKVQSLDYYHSLARSENGKAAAQMLDSLFVNGNAFLADKNSDLTKLIRSLDTLAAEHDIAGLDKLATSAAGASVPGLAMAVGNDMDRQLRAIRNRTTTMGVDQCVANDKLPYYNAWVNAEGDYASVSGSGTEAGYKLNSFGGTVGFDVDMTPNLTMGLALTAMRGDYSSNDVDHGDGNVNTEYLTFFGRYARRAWTHSFVAAAGLAQADLDRTVQHAGGSYSTTGSTDATSFGLLYEVGHVSKLNEDGSVCLQPFANVSFVHSSLSGYNESGSDAALKVGDVDYNAVTVGLGARLQGMGGENIYNRSAIYEVRALAKIHAGDRSAEAEMGIRNTKPATIRSAEIGTVGCEVGAGITLPVGSANSSLFADFSVEVNSAYTEVNGTVGYRVNF